MRHVVPDATVDPEPTLVELPIFDFGIVIRSGGIRPLRTGVYVMPVDFTIRTIICTLAVLDIQSNPGPQVAFFRNGVGQWTSAKLTANVTTFNSGSGAFAPNISCPAGSQVFMQITSQGNGRAAGLTVMCRE